MPQIPLRPPLPWAFSLRGGGSDAPCAPSIGKPSWCSFTYLLFVSALSPGCLLQEQAKTLRRVGRGGLNEDAGPSDEAEAAAAVDGSGHRSATVAGTEIIRQPSEAEQVLRLIATQLRTLRTLPASQSENSVPCPKN